jgi:hypothetical protein
LLSFSSSSFSHLPPSPLLGPGNQPFNPSPAALQLHYPATAPGSSPASHSPTTSSSSPSAPAPSESNSFSSGQVPFSL